MSEEYTFKKFKNINSRQEHRITLTKSGSIGLPTKFYKDNGISNYKYAIIYYDEEKKAVGIQFTSNEEEQNKYKIVRGKGGYGGGIVARSFIKNYNIDPKVYYGRYEWTKMQVPDVGELYVIELKENANREVA